jgi:hypothetical protein
MHLIDRESVGLLGRVISPVARPLPTQNNTNIEETRTDIHASSGIRTHGLSVWAGEDISDREATVIGEVDRKKKILITSKLNWAISTQW